MDMLDKIVDYATRFKLSDIHVHSGEAVALRLHGEIVMQTDDMMDRATVERFVDSILDSEQKAAYLIQKDADLAITHKGMRFRANIYNSINGPCFVLRKIETNIPNIEDLGLPAAVMNATNERNGLVLVTGPTGSGKSTTLAAMINKINQTRKENIITIEDPIEFIHQSKMCLVSQREVGRDAKTFTSALRASLREDPDVLLVGELRDYETISLALTAAETGHLVFGTLHTNGAPNTINRILDVFPPNQQAQARSQLSQSLRLVVTQQLIRRIDKEGRVAAFEVMVNNTAIANLIREGKIFQIDQALQTGKSLGMMTMEDSEKELMSKGIIAKRAPGQKAPGGH
ncbi:MAG: twitching motility protein PilT [Rickettsiales bacterium]|jgi:twitching motility protein PilT|nr:twitching motility protein PilT [Rickettsiales bacterium]